MAEINVEKKSSLAWLWWLLLLAGVIALVWFLVANDDEDDLVEDDEVALVDDNEPAAEPVEMDGDNTGPITALAGLAGLSDRIGSQVDLETVEVNRVIGDMAFTIGEGDNETLVRFDEVQTPNTAKEGLIDVNPGSVVSLEGRVDRLDYEGLPQSVKDDFGSDAEAYIFAERVDVQGGGVNPR